MKSICIGLFAGAVGWALVHPAFATEAARETVLYSFCRRQHCPDGNNPVGPLIELRGKLYGATSTGGSQSAGTLFRLDAATGAEKELYAFSGGNDGGAPLAGVIDLRGILYGTTYRGGTARNGTAFSFDRKTGVETVLHSFGSTEGDGKSPGGGLIEAKGILYGTTSAGGNDNSICGSYGCGTVFSIDPNTATETVLYSFCSQENCADGLGPGDLINVNGTLYGETQGGGSQVAYGTVFALDPGTSAETVVYSFCSQQNCADGAYPDSDLSNVKGTLYGMTHGGGIYNNTVCSAGCGTVFSIDPGTGTEHVLYAFCGQQNCADGQWPAGGLVHVGDRLYGMTSRGGSTDGGTVFSVNLRTGTEKVLYSFCSQTDCADGELPDSRLLNANGILYGTTWEGGASCQAGDNNCGVVFSLTEP